MFQYTPDASGPRVVRRAKAEEYRFGLKFDAENSEGALRGRPHSKIELVCEI
jgi:hypothetical protein